MKNILRYSVLFLAAFMLVACGTGDGANEDIWIVESEPIEVYMFK